MKHEYEVFEKFPDGSSLWCDSVPGSLPTRLRLQVLAQRSTNQFYAIDLVTGKVLASNSQLNGNGFCARSTTERSSKRQAASS